MEITWQERYTAFFGTLAVVYLFSSTLWDALIRWPDLGFVIVCLIVLGYAYIEWKETN